MTRHSKVLLLADRIKIDNVYIIHNQHSSLTLLLRDPLYTNLKKPSENGPEGVYLLQYVLSSVDLLQCRFASVFSSVIPGDKEHPLYIHYFDFFFTRTAPPTRVGATPAYCHAGIAVGQATNFFHWH